MVKIKVCGLTQKKNVLNVAKTGVDALGFILADSPRQVTLKKAKKLTADLAPFISRVGVVVNPSQKKLQQIIKSNIFDYIQFHGQKNISFINKSPLKNIKAISISSPKDLRQINDYQQIDFFLFDNKTKNQEGGTGKKFDWEYLNDLNIKVPFILAGGLGSHNILNALKNVKPNAVDLNSQIEKEPGLKDISLLKETITKIRTFES